MHRKGNRFAATFAALACACVLAPSADAAQTTFRFNAGGPGSSSVGVSDGRTTRNGHIELVRRGVVLARSLDRNGIGASSGHMRVPSLAAGDVLNAYGDGAVIATATYDGLPVIGADACTGHRSFTVTRDSRARVVWVGVYPPGRDGPPNERLEWADAGTFTATVTPALAAGQIARVVSRRDDGTTEVISRREVVVGGCSPAPTDAQVRRATRRAVTATGAKLGTLDPAKLAGATSVRLTFDFSEPGSVQLEITTKRSGKRVVVGSGTKTAVAPGDANVSVKLTAAGRRLLRRGTFVNVMLTATFSPARAGAKVQKSSTPVTRR